MSERKTIQFNPALLNVSNNNKTRKKREQNEKQIRVRENGQDRKQTLKRNLLNMIRNYQEDKQKQIMYDDHTHKKEQISAGYSDNVNNDFEESLKYLNNLSNETKSQPKNNSHHNYTLKNYNDFSSGGENMFPTNENVNIMLPDTFVTPEPIQSNNYFHYHLPLPLNLYLHITRTNLFLS